jgi:hypothetical protein
MCIYKGYVMRFRNTTRLAGFLLLCAMNWKIATILGSSHSYFSFGSVLAPMIALFGGITSATILLCTKMLVRGILHGATSFGPTFYIPTLCASWALARPYYHMVWYGIPIVCIVLFMLHPVGGQVWFYALYWWIPLVIAYGRYKSLFARALGATFIAHAVGSIIWLYTVPMTAAQWTALIPIVAVERITYAAGMVIVYHGVKFACAQFVVMQCTHKIYALMHKVPAIHDNK